MKRKVVSIGGGKSERKILSGIEMIRNERKCVLLAINILIFMELKKNINVIKHNKN